MLETHIKILATVYTALLMAVVSYVLLFGGFEIKSPVVKGKVISATMVDISQLKSRSKPKEVKKQQTVKKDPPKKDPPKKKQEIKPVEQVKKDPPKKDPPRIVKKTPVVDTKAQDLERKKTQERKKKLEDIRKKRIAAEKRAKQEEQNLIDLANKTKETEKTQPQQNVGNTRGKSDADKKQRLMIQYQLAVISKVHWSKPVSANKILCRVKVRQIPGGGVIDATISTPCNANTIVKNSIITAIKKADPLPYKGFESVFSRIATFTFESTDD